MCILQGVNLIVFLFDLNNVIVCVKLVAILTIFNTNETNLSIIIFMKAFHCVGKLSGIVYLFNRVDDSATRELDMTVFQFSIETKEENESTFSSHLWYLPILISRTINLHDIHVCRWHGLAICVRARARFSLWIGLFSSRPTLISISIAIADNTKRPYINLHHANPYSIVIMRHS